MQTVRDGWPSESNDDACSRRTTDVARDRTLRLGVFDSTQPQLCRYRYSRITRPIDRRGHASGAYAGNGLWFLESALVKDFIDGRAAGGARGHAVIGSRRHLSLRFVPSRPLGGARLRRNPSHRDQAPGLDLALPMPFSEAAGADADALSRPSQDSKE